MWAQSAPTTPASGGANSSTDPKDETPLQLSPFTVTTERDRGYFAENTLAGSRINTNISDLGASISVITKQQLDDTASLDVNDVFRYEINTEGSSTYTPAVATFRNDGPLDVIAGGTQGNSVDSFTNATANRVRGIGTPSASINYYPANGKVPLDAYNVQSVEISRGPNSMLFGMGSPAGVVNQNPTSAVLNRNHQTAQVRVDDRGSYRGSFAINRSLIEDELALYGAVLYDNRQFERKPSYDITRRQYGALTYKPFSKTVIKASVEGYHNDNRRPNNLTPRDYVTEWRLAGQPTYDPVTKMVTKLSTGQVMGPYLINAAHPDAQRVRDYIMSLPNYNPALRDVQNDTFTSYNGVSIFGGAAMTNVNSILFVPGLGQVSAPRTTMQIADGRLVNWFQPLYGQRYRTEWGTAANPAANAPVFPTAEADIWANPAWANVYSRDYTFGGGRPITATPMEGAIHANISNYRYPGVTDKSVYDWEEINISQMNFGQDRNANYNIELEQQITRDLFLSAGWFRQDFDQATNYTVSQLNVATLFVDTNRNLPDGSPNPFFGKPYVEDFEPDRYINSQVDDHYRAMLAYTPDFTRQNSWLRWLGRHQILGLWSKDRSTLTSYRQRLQFVDAEGAARFRYLNNQNANADGSPTGWSFQGTSMRRAFYLASPNDPVGTGVTRSSGEWNHLRHSANIRVYDYANSRFEDLGVTTAFNTHEAGTGRNQRQIESLSAGITSYLWNERLVTTFGVRKDEYRARGTTTGSIRDAAGNEILPAMTNAEKWVNGVFQDEVVFDRWNLWDELSGTTRTAGGVFRPFRNWNGIERRAATSPLWQFVRDFGISYNESDNFNPPPSAQVDAFGTFLPKPTGEGKDYGFQFSMFDNKLFARITWFEATNQAERTSPGASISRLTGNIDTTLFRNWARTIAMINMGMDPRVEGFGANLTPAEEDQIQAAAEKIWGLPYDYYNTLPGAIGATRNAEAEGIEAQINYNPTPNWTMRFTFGKQDTVYSNVLNEFTAWHAVRDPVWQNAKAADHLLPEYRHLATYTDPAGRPVDLTNFWTSYGFRGEVRPDDIFGNTNVARYYDINVTPQIALARDLEGQKAPGQRRYRWSFLTNYRFTEALKGLSVGGSVRWEDKAVIGYYGKPSGADPANPDRLDLSDVTRPIYDDANTYTDLWAAYQIGLSDKLRMKLQLNVVNAFESGRLQTVAVDYNGTPNAFRIVDPRQIILTATFDF